MVGGALIESQHIGDLAMDVNVSDELLIPHNEGVIIHGAHCHRENDCLAQVLIDHLDKLFLLLRLNDLSISFVDYRIMTVVIMMNVQIPSSNI